MTSRTYPTIVLINVAYKLVYLNFGYVVDQWKPGDQP